MSRFIYVLFMSKSKRIQITDEQLAVVLVEGGFLSQKRVDELKALAAQENSTFMQVISDYEVIPDDQLGQILAAEMDLPFVHLLESEIDENLIQKLPKSFVRNEQVVPFRETADSVDVAVLDPYKAQLKILLEKRFGKPVRFFYATSNNLKQLFHVYRKHIDRDIQDLVKKVLSSSQALAANGKKEKKQNEVVQILDLLLEYAYISKASDLHVEPQEKNTIIRFRVDGFLRDVIAFPKGVHEALLSRMKILSHLRIDEHLASQDGHFQYLFDGEKVDIRLSVIPTVFGEKSVLRLLSEKSRQYGLEQLGMEPSDLALLESQAKRPWGMILTTGPTGAGKTTTLYAVLKLLNRRNVNISTIEDPVEYSIAGVNQIQVNKTTNLDFASGLRSIVRQDPDIIMVGEIRDSETADISVNAALTGHLVLSTLHTNDAATALPRLLDMGVEPFLIASTVNVVVAQRLVRNICKHCIRSFEAKLQDLVDEGFIIPEVLKEDLFKTGSATLYKGEGCEKCSFQGYSGRSGVYELLVVDSEIRKMIVEKTSSDVIRTHAISKGMTTMFRDAIKKVKRGVTTLEEALRVVRDL